VADRRSRQRQPPDFIGVEMDAMREPGPLAKPSAIVEIVERAAAVELLTETVLVLGFGEVVCSRTFSSAVVTENGEQGASAICTMASSARW
jgi:hypothetical protein